MLEHSQAHRNLLTGAATGIAAGALISQIASGHRNRGERPQVYYDEKPHGRKKSGKLRFPKKKKSDEEILRLGKQLSDLAHRQNLEDQRAAGARTPSNMIATAQWFHQTRKRRKHRKELQDFLEGRDDYQTGRIHSTGRGIGMSHMTRDSSVDDSDEWEDMSDEEDTSASSSEVDSGLVYGSAYYSVDDLTRPYGRSEEQLAYGEGWRPYPSGSSIVDPTLMHPSNSLRRHVDCPCGFDMVEDTTYLYGHHPKSSRHGEYLPALPQPLPSGRQQHLSSDADPMQCQPMKVVHPITTSDPAFVDVDQPVAPGPSEGQHPSRPGRTSPQAVDVQIHTPRPMKPAKRNEIEAVAADYDPKLRQSSGHISSIGKTALAVGAGAVGATVARAALSLDNSNDERREDCHDKHFRGSYEREPRINSGSESSRQYESPSEEVREKDRRARIRAYQEAEERHRAHAKHESERLANEESKGREAERMRIAEKVASEAKIARQQDAQRKNEEERHLCREATEAEARRPTERAELKRRAEEASREIRERQAQREREVEERLHVEERIRADEAALIQRREQEAEERRLDQQRRDRETALIKKKNREREAENRRLAEERRNAEETAFLEHERRQREAAVLERLEHEAERRLLEEEAAATEREHRERKAAETSRLQREAERRRLAEEAAHMEYQRRQREAAAREQLERGAERRRLDEEAAAAAEREHREREAAERAFLERETERRRVVEEAARIKQQRRELEAAEQARQVEAERLAREEADRVEKERTKREQAEREEFERRERRRRRKEEKSRACEEKTRLEAQRQAAVQRTVQEYKEWHEAEQKKRKEVENSYWEAKRRQEVQMILERLKNESSFEMAKDVAYGSEPIRPAGSLTGLKRRDSDKASDHSFTCTKRELVPDDDPSSPPSVRTDIEAPVTPKILTAEPKETEAEVKERIDEEYREWRKKARERSRSQSPEDGQGRSGRVVTADNGAEKDEDRGDNSRRTRAKKNTETSIGSKPNSDNQFDKQLYPLDLHTYEKPQYADSLLRPVLNLVRPTPSPSPFPEKQAERACIRDPAEDHLEKVSELEGSGRQAVFNNKGEFNQVGTSRSAQVGVTQNEADDKSAQSTTEVVSPAKKDPKLTRGQRGWGSVFTRIIGFSGAASQTGEDEQPSPEPEETQHEDARSTDDQESKVEELKEPVISSGERKTASVSPPKPIPKDLAAVDDMAAEIPNLSDDKHPHSPHTMPGTFDEPPHPADLDLTAVASIGLREIGYDEGLAQTSEMIWRQTSPGSDPELDPYRKPVSTTVPEDPAPPHYHGAVIVDIPHISADQETFIGDDEPRPATSTSDITPESEIAGPRKNLKKLSRMQQNKTLAASEFWGDVIGTEMKNEQEAERAKKAVVEEERDQEPVTSELVKRQSQSLLEQESTLVGTPSFDTLQAATEPEPIAETHVELEKAIPEPVFIETKKKRKKKKKRGSTLSTDPASVAEESAKV